jgi:hypothetical protein
MTQVELIGTIDMAGYARYTAQQAEQNQALIRYARTQHLMEIAVRTETCYWCGQESEYDEFRAGNWIEVCGNCAEYN